LVSSSLSDIGKHIPEQWNLAYFPPKTDHGLPYCTAAPYASAPATLVSQ
jgi:hypothetical protein